MCLTMDDNNITNNHKIINSNSAGNLSACTERQTVAWPCNNKLAGRVFHIDEIATCQLLR